MVYKVESGKPLSQMYWSGAAMSKMTINILELDGTLIKANGPYAGGNRWGEFTISFPPRKKFIVKMSNYVSTWYYINSIEFR